MTVSLPTKLEVMVRAKIVSGAYRDEGEVLSRALELLARYDAEVQAKRGMIREGVESGPPRETDIDALLDSLNAKFDRR